MTEDSKPRVGVITLGLKADGAYQRRFMEDLSRVVQASGDWAENMPWWRYDRLDFQKVVDSCDTLVLSPGDAKVGLRETRDPSNPILKVYDFIEELAKKGVPVLGINAGHMAVHNAYGWGIIEVPESERDTFKARQEYFMRTDDGQIVKADDPLLAGIDKITMQLTNGWVVPIRCGQIERLGQDNIEQIATYRGSVLISRVKSKAPVYGVQFNIQPGTEAVFRSFFGMAYDYVRR